jgi:hypothetical protein
MNPKIKKTTLLILFITCTSVMMFGQLYEWRGPGRTGIYDEKGLQKRWPDGGPKLLWSYESSGFGYSSPIVTNDAV